MTRSTSDLADARTQTIDTGKRRTRLWKRLGVALAGLTVGTAGSFAPVAASVTGASAPTTAGTGVQSQVCATFVDKLQPGQQVSAIRDRACANTVEEARAQLPAADVLLVVFYQNSNFKGKMDYMYGADPCDVSGYGFKNLYQMQDRIDGMSSFALHSQCDAAEGYRGTNFAGRCGRWTYSPVAYVGAACNDQIHSMRVWNYPG